MNKQVLLILLIIYIIGVIVIYRIFNVKKVKDESKEIKQTEKLDRGYEKDVIIGRNEKIDGKVIMFFEKGTIKYMKPLSADFTERMEPERNEFGKRNMNLSYYIDVFQIITNLNV